MKQGDKVQLRLLQSTGGVHVVQTVGATCTNARADGRIDVELGDGAEMVKVRRYDPTRPYNANDTGCPAWLPLDGSMPVHAAAAEQPHAIADVNAAGEDPSDDELAQLLDEIEDAAEEGLGKMTRDDLVALTERAGLTAGRDTKAELIAQLLNLLDEDDDEGDSRGS